MTNPTDEELGEAVAEVIGWHRMQSGMYKESPLQPHKNWAALMVAGAKLEEKGTRFTRNRSVWSVDETGNNYACWYKTGDSQSEARALALCIHSVVNQ